MKKIKGWLMIVLVLTLTLFTTTKSEADEAVSEVGIFFEEVVESQDSPPTVIKPTLPNTENKYLPQTGEYSSFARTIGCGLLGAAFILRQARPEKINKGNKR